MSSQVITFGSVETTTTDNFTFEIAGEKSVFNAGETATLNMFPSDLSAKLSVSSGTAVFKKRGEVLEQTEYVIFANSDTAYLKYPAARLIAAEWQGRINGAPSISGTAIVLPAVSSGVLKITYETKYDILDVVCPIQSHCLLEAKSDTRYGYADIDYTYGIGGAFEVVFRVRNACTNTPLAGADVWLNGEYKGKTNNDGYINFGMLNVGKYNVVSKKEGFVDSDKDIIANDSFTVE